MAARLAAMEVTKAVVEVAVETNLEDTADTVVVEESMAVTSGTEELPVACVVVKEVAIVVEMEAAMVVGAMVGAERAAEWVAVKAVGSQGATAEGPRLEGTAEPRVAEARAEALTEPELRAVVPAALTEEAVVVVAMAVAMGLVMAVKTVEVAATAPGARGMDRLLCSRRGRCIHRCPS